MNVMSLMRTKRTVAVTLIVLAAAAMPALSADGTAKPAKSGRTAKTRQTVTATSLPTAEKALRRAMAAHGTLGPTAIRITLEELKDGKAVSTRVQSVQRNDPDHYVTEFTEGEVKVRLIARGDDLVLHNVTRNAYRRGRNYRMDLAMPFSRIRDEIAKGLKDPKTAAALKKARVSRSTVGGAPVYRLYWPEAVKLGTLPLRSLSIGVEGGLMRQILLQDSNATMRATARYTPRKAPFPASLFDFTPPPGARDLAAPEPEPEPEPAPEPEPSQPDAAPGD